MITVIFNTGVWARYTQVGVWGREYPRGILLFLICDPRTHTLNPCVGGFYYGYGKCRCCANCATDCHTSESSVSITTRHWPQVPELTHWGVGGWVGGILCVTDSNLTLYRHTPKPLPL